MTETLYLLDGMALIYRAHYALIKNPVFTASGVNTSALYGFTNTLLDLLETRKPSHLAIALDTHEPTARHIRFPAYKAQRDAMPEDIGLAIPAVERLAAAMNIPLLKYPGYEADDIIGTLATRYASDDLKVVMVTPDKDFSQLVGPATTILKPGRQGAPPDILGVPEIIAAWEVPTPAAVIDVLALWGDASDNIPGVPGCGEKTAKKLIAEFGSMDALYARLDEVKGRLREKLEANREQAYLCRDLVTIITDVPVRETIEDFRLRPRDDAAVQALFVEYEFNSLGRRLFGPDFKAGRGTAPPPPPAPRQGELFATEEVEPATPVLKTIADVPHDYTLIDDDEATRVFAETLNRLERFCFDIETDRLDPRKAMVAGIAFCHHAGKAAYVRLPAEPEENRRRLALLAVPLENPAIEKTGQNLKFDISVLAWQGVEVRGRLFDTMIAHALIEPERRHGMNALAEQYLGYSPIPITRLIGEPKQEQITMFDVEPPVVAEYAAEDADVTWQLRAILEPMLNEQAMAPVFNDIEMPLLPVLVHMERAGIRLDTAALAVASEELAATMATLETRIIELAGESFNLNSPKQLGDILFGKLQLGGKAKKTRTGQYATDESILETLAGEHEIVRKILDYREAAKLKSTYVDSLPHAVFSRTGRIHTQYAQTGAITGRLASANPNLQNIPIRSEMGRQIRAAFTAADENHRLLSADYSQIELRVMASLSRDPAMIEAFEQEADVHAATAARVFHVPLAEVTGDMRRKAKMVNFGIIFGISAFGLSQRLGIPRREAAEIIEEYFNQYPGVKTYMESTVAECRAKGYTETITGRRRRIRDIGSANANARTAAERTAINTPIQGTAADMIKIAMARIDDELQARKLKARLLLQVHDELLLEYPIHEQETVTELVERHMREALPLRVPVKVDSGSGFNWLEAHPA